MTAVVTAWREVALGDICEFKYGRSLPATNRRPGQFAVFGSNGRVGAHDEAITDGPTIIIGRKGSLGEVTYSADSCWPIDTTYYVDVSATAADLRWLHYRLRGLGLIELNKAAAVPGLNRDDAYRQRLLLPPVEEQRRIADILDQADALRAKRRESLALLDDLAHSIFLKLFGADRNWPLRPLGELMKVKSGSFLPASEMASGGTFPVYGGNGINGFHDEFLFEHSQVVIGRVGAYCGAVHLTRPCSWITDNALYVADLSADLTQTYLAHALTHANLNQYASQSGQPLISGGRIYPVEIAVPTREVQSQFAAIAMSIDRSRQVLGGQEARLGQLFGSLQQRAFAGLL